MDVYDKKITIICFYNEKKTTDVYLVGYFVDKNL